jgi:hypothetical protein
MDLDGYVITATGAEALEAFGRPGVRHIATLESGEGFVAFEGDRPAAGALLIASDEALPWWWHKVRNLAPAGPEAFYLLTAARFADFVYAELGRGFVEPVVAATLLATGNVLVQTNGFEVIPGAIWGSTAVSYRDVRLEAALA